MFCQSFVLLAGFLVALSDGQQLPAFIKQQCHSSDPKLTSCIEDSIIYLKPFLKAGIPEIAMPSIEPFKLDELSLSLSTGPTGYKITLKDTNIYGASNFSISRLKLSENSRPFEARVKMPQLKIKARYTSSGVLFIIPASGNGTFHAIFDGVTSNIKGQVKTVTKNNEAYIQVDTLDLDLNVKNVKMTVKRIFNNNRILIEATNLFLRENGQEVLRAMLPQLRVQLSVEFKRIVNTLLNNVPVNRFYVQD